MYEKESQRVKSRNKSKEQQEVGVVGDAMRQHLEHGWLPRCVLVRDLEGNF